MNERIAAILLTQINHKLTMGTVFSEKRPIFVAVLYLIARIRNHQLQRERLCCERILGGCGRSLEIGTAIRLPRIGDEPSRAGLGQRQVAHEVNPCRRGGLVHSHAHVVDCVEVGDQRGGSRLRVGGNRFRRAHEVGAKLRHAIERDCDDRIGRAPAHYRLGVARPAREHVTRRRRRRQRHVRSVGDPTAAVCLRRDDDTLSVAHGNAPLRRAVRRRVNLDVERAALVLVVISRPETVRIGKRGRGARHGLALEFAGNHVPETGRASCVRRGREEVEVCSVLLDVD